jgi:hypothetical protein
VPEGFQASVRVQSRAERKDGTGNQGFRDKSGNPQGRCSGRAVFIHSNGTDRDPALHGESPVVSFSARPAKSIFEAQTVVAPGRLLHHYPKSP